jgi:hypothetical protein
VSSLLHLFDSFFDNGVAMPRHCIQSQQIYRYRWDFPRRHTWRRFLSASIFKCSAIYSTKE